MLLTVAGVGGGAAVTGRAALPPPVDTAGVGKEGNSLIPKWVCLRCATALLYSFAERYHLCDGFAVGCAVGRALGTDVGWAVGESVGGVGDCVGVLLG